MMPESIFAKAYNQPLLTAADVDAIAAKHVQVHFKKGEYLLREGEVAQSFSLVQSGLLRVYVHDYKGDEITTDFHHVGEISIEVNSLFQRTPSQENIVALTDGTAWQISYDNFQELFHQLPGMREWGRAWMAQQLFITKSRATDMVVKSAAERYGVLLSQKPYILQHAPLKYIASYLGITDSSLSRIRKDIG